MAQTPLPEDFQPAVAHASRGEEQPHRAPPHGGHIEELLDEATQRVEGRQTRFGADPPPALVKRACRGDPPVGHCMPAG
jgi:hypothetical protein